MSADINETSKWRRGGDFRLRNCRDRTEVEQAEGPTEGTYSRVPKTHESVDPGQEPVEEPEHEAPREPAVTRQG